jgi:hypothetical protein
MQEDGIIFFNHKEKERIFSNFYRNILGKTAETQPLIKLEELYSTSPNRSSLSRPFSEKEILHALKQIPRDKSPARPRWLWFGILSGLLVLSQGGYP